MASTRAPLLTSARFGSRRRRGCGYDSSYRLFSSVDVKDGPKAATVRKQMVPLIKLVHPDLFGQYPADVANTNQKSLKDLNTLIDAAEALEKSRADNKNTNGTSSPTVDSVYRLTFFHHKIKAPSSTPNKSSSSQNDHEHSTNGNNGKRSGAVSHRNISSGDDKSAAGAAAAAPLLQLHAELRFPSVLTNDPAGSLREQLREQLGQLLDTVHELTNGPQAGDRRTVDGQRAGMKDHGVGGEDRGGRSARRTGPPSRAGIRMERFTSADYDYELADLILRHAGENHFGAERSINLGVPFFEDESRRPDQQPLPLRMRVTREKAGRQANKKALLVDALLRSGRVQFAGVPIVREAAALVKLHKFLSSHFDELEIADKDLWSTVTIVLRAKATNYEVKAHTNGPILVVPENFSEKNLVRFLSETLLGHG